MNVWPSGEGFGLWGQFISYLGWNLAEKSCELVVNWNKNWLKSIIYVIFLSMNE